MHKYNMRKKEKQSEIRNQIDPVRDLLFDLFHTYEDYVIMSALADIADTFMWNERDDHNPVEAKLWGGTLTDLNKIKARFEKYYDEN